MKPTWIIENFSKEPSFKELTAAVKQLGYPLIEINGDYKKEILAPLNKFIKGYEVGEIGETTNPVKIWDKNCVVLNGTIKMCKVIKEDLGDSNNCYPVTYSTFSKYKCSAYYSHFGSFLFNDKYCLMPLKELERQKFDVFGHYGKDSLIFIRPDSGEKDFQAGLLDFLDLGKFIDNHQDCLHDLILVSTPKNIKWEGRFVVGGGEIIAHSTYRYQGQVTRVRAVPEGAKKLCQKLININYNPDSVYCLDLVEDNDGEFWLMEVTSFSSAGLYDCDMIKVVQKVSEIAEKDFKKKFDITT